MSTITCSSIVPGISKRSAHVDHHMLIHYAWHIKEGAHVDHHMLILVPGISERSAHVDHHMLIHYAWHIKEECSCRPSHAHPSCLAYQRGVLMSTITCSSIMPDISKRSAHGDHHMLIHYAWHIKEGAHVDHHMLIHRAWHIKEECSCRPSHAHPSCLTYQRGVLMETITCSSIMPDISKRSAHGDHHMLIHRAWHIKEECSWRPSHAHPSCLAYQRCELMATIHRAWHIKEECSW